MKIKNFEELAVNGMRQAVLEIAEAGLNGIDTKSILRKSVKIEDGNLSVYDEKFLLKEGGRIFVVGVGKCAADGAEELENILGNRLSAGAVIDVKETRKLKTIKSYVGTHPLPSEENIEAIKEIVKILKNLDEDDLVIFIVSGGGSTLLCLPDDKGCLEERGIVQTLMKAGAPIQEINVVRKHLSFARGGYLAKYAYPAKIISLIFSDVPTDDIQFIASGPTVRDTTTIQDAEEVLAKYEVLRVCGIEKCGLIETPKEENYFKSVKNIVIVSNRTALDAMRMKAENLGFRVEICTNCISGEAREAGKRIIGELAGAFPKTVLLYGGETTVTVKGHGKGGRNMELVLSALKGIRDGQIIMAIATDGVDNTEFAGAICDILTKEKAKAEGLDPKKFLQNNDSYHFFEKTGDYIITGKTGSNVSDLIIAIKS